MSQLNDAKLAFYFAGGHLGALPEAELSWLQAQNAAVTSNTRDDAWRQFLDAVGFATGNNDDDWFAYLGSLGYTGQINDRELAFYSGADPGPGPGPGFVPFGDDATLHFPFAQTKSLTASVGGVTLAHQRVGGASYIESDGLIQYVADDEPRYSHDPVTLQSLGLMIEDSRTNILLHSEDLSRSPWSNFQSVDTQNVGTAPDGKNTANRLTDDGGGGSGTCRMQQSVVIATGVDYVCSIFAKRDTLDWLAIATFNFDAGANGDTYFNIADGTVGSSSVHKGAGIDEYPNGWYRCWIVFNSATDASGRIDIRLAQSNNSFPVPRDGTSRTFLWGAHLERGISPASYIPTEADSVTRSATDVFTSDITWFNPAQASWYMECDTYNAFPRVNVSVWRFSGSASLSARHRVGTGNFDMLGATNPSGNTVTSGVPFAVSTPHRWAHACSNGQAFNSDFDGVNALTDGVSGSPDPGAGAVLRLGGNNGAEYWNGHIADVAYGDVRASNEYLAWMTGDRSGPEPAVSGP